MRQSRFGEVSKDFGLFCRNSRNLFCKLLNLSNKVFPEHVVLISVRRTQVGPLLASQSFFVISEGGVDGSQGTARMQGIRECAQDLIRVDIVVGRDVPRGDMLVRRLVSRRLTDTALAECLFDANVIEWEVFG